jgi:hypothetical protein
VWSGLAARSPMPQSLTESSHVAATRVYVRTFLIAGVVIPIFLHVIASKAMPWWPDTVSMGIAFGVVAVLVVSKTRSEREQNRRLWKALRNLARHRDWC